MRERGRGLSERIAFAITSEVIALATHLVDVHCGDGNESLAFVGRVTEAEPRP